MDHGTLTDANGRETDFRNTIIIMTTNVGADEMTHRNIGFSQSNAFSLDKGTEALGKAFSPEFRNRLDAIVTFGHLPKETMLEIVDKFMRELESKLSSKSLKLVVSEQARAYLAEKGYDPAFGARPMRRLVQKEVKKPLSELLLTSRPGRGCIIKVGFNKSRSTITIKFSKASDKSKTKKGTKVRP